MQKSLFNRIANWASRIVGSPKATIVAFLIILIWAVTGPMFGFSDTWQLVINTGTTIVTFLMVFLIQNTQNRDSRALHLKMDELLRTTKGAHNVLLDFEELTEEELDKIRDKYEELAHKARKLLQQGKHDTSTPYVELLAEPAKRRKKK